MFGVIRDGPPAATQYKRLTLCRSCDDDVEEEAALYHVVLGPGLEQVL